MTSLPGHRVQPDSIDLLCLPEMALTGVYLCLPRNWFLERFLPPFGFSKRGLTSGHPDPGYVFHGPGDIRPFAEQPRTGPTSTFVSELAARLRCYVMAGYPEVLPAEEDDDPRYGAYNSAAIFGPGGEYIGGGRKTNMYIADLPWCKPGAFLCPTTGSGLTYHQVTDLLTSNFRPPLSGPSRSGSAWT
jgi:predicted amidohydrolase